MKDSNAYDYEIKNEKLDLPFDLYTRNILISKLVNGVRNKRKLKILDVGGRGGQLKDFLKEDKCYVLDLRESERREEIYIVGDIRDAPLKNSSFDVVISSDLYEHIPREDRLKTVSEMLRLSKNFIILGAPFYSKEVEEAERKAYNFFLKNTGEPHPWLKEHIENGLPLRDELEDFLIEKGYEFYILETNNISNWLLLQFLTSYAYNYGLPEEKVSKVYRYYNENFVDLGDFLEPTYRKIYLVGKRGTLPTLELKIDKSVDESKRQNLLSLVFDCIAEINTVIQEKDNHIRNLESTLQSMQSSITWQLLRKYQGLIERILPLGTRRRHAYDLCSIGIRVIINEDWRSFWIKFKRLFCLRIPVLNFHIKQPLIETNILNFQNHIPLSLEKELVGKFVFPANNLNEIRILTATYQRKSSDLVLYLKEKSMNGPIIRKARVKWGNILNNDYTSFRFKTIKDSAGETFLFALKSMGEPSAAVYYDPELSFPDLQLFYGGEEIGGSINFQAFAKLKVKDPYEFWILKNEPTKEKLEEYKKESLSFEYRPKISIITPVWNTDEKWLRAAIESVLNQVYDNWELCITDGGSTMPHVKKILKEYAKKDKRIKVKFLPENKGIAGNSNEALKLATGEFVVLLDHDDELALFALYEVVKVLNESRDIDFIYSDEDKIDEKGNYVDPFFKPDFSIHLLRSMNYLIHVAVMRKELVEQVSGFNSEFDGAQDYDLFFRLLEKTNKVYHIRKILYHWRKSSSSGAQNPLAKPWIYEKGKLALQCHLIRLGIEGIANIGGGYGLYFVDYKIKDTPAVDIIIPTRKMSLFKKCLKSIRNNTTWKNYKIWAVINGNYDYEIVEIKDGTELDGFANKDTGLIGPPLPYNWSRMNNLAVSRTKAPYIIFLNDDIQIITDNWIENMLQYAQQKDVGGVGVMLLYPDNSIQHAGDFITENGTGDHCFNGMDSRSFEINGLAQVVREVSAVTGACMMVRRDVFEEVGGFDENLRNFDDYDFCLRLRESGYKLIYTPYSKLYHHESPTRPQILDNKMVRYLLGRHKSKRFDPFYRYEWINMYNRARQR